MRVGRSCTQNRRHDARRGLERVRSEPYPARVPRAALAILGPTWSLPGHLLHPSRIFRAAWRQFSIYTVNSQRAVNINAESASQTVYLGRFITYHHIGNLLAILCKDGTAALDFSWWIGFGVSPWFSATTRRLFGRVCRRKPLHRIGNSPLASAPAARRSTARDTTAPHRTTEPRSAPHAEPPGRDPTAPVPSRRSSGKKDVCVEATNGPPRGRLRDGPARVHRGSRAIHRAPTRPRLRRGHRADWKGAFHPATSTHRAPRPASSSEPIQVNLVHSASFRQTFADARHPSASRSVTADPIR